MSVLSSRGFHTVVVADDSAATSDEADEMAKTVDVERLGRGGGAHIQRTA